MRGRQQLEAAFAASLRRPVQHCLVLLFFAVLPLATTWPLVQHLGTHVPGEVAGDNLSSLWSFWWMRQALASSDVDFWRTTFLFHPGGVDLVQHTHTALNAGIGATVLGGVSEITALNLVLLGALTLAGFGTYLLAWDITGHRGASVVAGVFFCSAPFFPARLLGHFNFVSAWGLPFFAWLWLRVFRLTSSSPEATSGAFAMFAAAGVLAAVAYTDYYYLAYLLLFMACALAMRWARVSWVRPASPIVWTWADTAIVALLAIVIALHIAIAMTGGFTLHAAGARISMRNGLNVRTVAWVLALVLAWRRVRWRPRVERVPVVNGSIARDLAMTGFIMFVFALAIFPLLEQSLEIWNRGDYVELDKRWHSAPIGIDPLALLFGNPFHPLYGAASRALYAAADIDRLELIAWLGVVPLVILIAWRRHWLAREAAGTAGERYGTRLWIAITVVFGIWALGPYLRVMGTHTGLWLPASLVQYVSILSSARMPSRAMVMVYLSVGVLLAIALAARDRATGKPLRAGVILGIAAAILIDFAAVPIALYRIDRPAIFQQLAAMPPGTVCVLPLGLRDGTGELGRFEHRALADQMVHGKPLIGGFVARLPKSVFQQHEQAPIIGSLLRLSSGEALSDADLARDRAAIASGTPALPFRYVVLHQTDTAPRLRAYITSMLRVQLVRSEHGIELYSVLR
jgi:hypothetical protein